MRQVQAGLKPQTGVLIPQKEMEQQQRKKSNMATNDQLITFSQFEDDPRAEEDRKTGRAWRIDELRLKDHTDLHKLWYVLLKEKNKLKSDHIMQIQMQSNFFRFTDLKKVRLSMARLLTVVNERKKIRTLFRQQLEDEYIAKKKEQELNAFLAKREKSKVTKGIKE